MRWTEPPGSRTSTRAALAERGEQCSLLALTQLDLPDPDSSAPASRYARRSSSKLAGNVVICEIEKRGVNGRRALADGCPPAWARRSEELLRPTSPSRHRAPARGCSRRYAKPVDGGRMSRARREGPPEEVLVESERPAVGIAVKEVDVRPLQVGRRENHTRLDRALQVRDLACEPGNDPVGVAFPKLLGPRPAGVELACRVTARATEAPGAGSTATPRLRARDGPSSAAGRRRSSPRRRAFLGRPR